MHGFHGVAMENMAMTYLGICNTGQMHYLQMYRMEIDVDLIN